jgi:hypothetical protein
LEEQLTSFSSLELPNIRADRDSPYQPSSSPRTKKDRYNNGGWDGSFIPRRSSLNSSASSVKVKAVPTDRSPTLRTLSDLTARLKGLCVGLCLDCLKGNDVCRSPYPDPWVAYRRSLGLWFEENTDPEENVSPIQWPAWVCMIEFANMEQVVLQVGYVGEPGPCYKTGRPSDQGKS